MITGVAHGQVAETTTGSVLTSDIVGVTSKESGEEKPPHTSVPGRERMLPFPAILHRLFGFKKWKRAALKKSLRFPVQHSIRAHSCQTRQFQLQPTVSADNWSDDHRRSRKCRSPRN
jgi:hypothetical protein